MRRAAAARLALLRSSHSACCAGSIALAPVNVAAAAAAAMGHACRVEAAAAASLLLPAAARLCPAQQAQYQQVALFRSLLRSRASKTSKPVPMKPPPTRPLKGPVRRVLWSAGKALGLAVVTVPLAAVGALVVSGWEDAEATELILSLPRSARTVWWGARAAYRYKALAARHPDRKSEEYLGELAALHEEEAQRLLLLCQANGGMYIKAGQLAVALRAVPQEYRTILEVLQDRVPSRPFEEIDKALVKELGAPASELFSRFDPVATAAASLAQVHRAWLRDGSPVAVKVQYPGLQAAVMGDVASMTVLAKAGARLFPDVNLVWLFEELQRKLVQELDFRIEATNSQRLAECMRGRQDVAVPRVVPELCGRRVLCMEWVDGCKVTDEESLQRAGLDPKAVGMLLLEAFADMTFVHGHVHGDPHPGNILVRADWASQGWFSWLMLGRQPRPQLVLLDHGLYIDLPRDMRLQYCQMWCAFVLNDKDTAAQAATALGGERAGRILPEVLRPRNWATVSKEERRQFRQEAGIHSFSDLAEILEQAPRSLLDTLRITAMVRHTAAQLGATIADRLRINVTAAFRGMRLHAAATEASNGSDAAEGSGAPVRAAVAAAAAGAATAAGRGRRRGAAGGASMSKKGGIQVAGSAVGGGRMEYFGVLRSRSKRWQLELRIWLLRGAFWLASVLQGLMVRVMPPTAVVLT
ncbi:hypothetical protein N2152v2_007786 [Parachlorella kessleri]